MSRTVQLQKILEGLTKYYPSGSIPLGGVTYTSGDLEKLVQSDLDAIEATAKARDAWMAQVALERQARAKSSPTLLRLKNYVLTTLGDTQDAQAVLGTFGYSPRKRQQPSSAVKAEAAAKAKATRKAREPAPKPVEIPPAGAGSPAKP